MSAVEEIAASIALGQRRAAGSIWARLGYRDRFAVMALLVLVAASFLSPFFAPHDPATPVATPFMSPGAHALFGTDDVGRDIFSRVLFGARESMLGAFAVIAVGAAFGTLVGLIAGARPGWVDSLLMRTTDAFLALPAPMLAIAVVAAIGPSFTNALLAVSVVWWPVYARLVRGEIRALAARPSVEAATLAGVSTARLWLRHLLPGALAPVVITASLDVGGLILVLASLSFLGLGSPDPATELGAMTSGGLPYLLSSPWVCLFPASAVFVIAFVTNLAGDAIGKLFARQ